MEEGFKLFRELVNEHLLKTEKTIPLLLMSDEFKKNNCVVTDGIGFIDYLLDNPSQPVFYDSDKSSGIVLMVNGVFMIAGHRRVEPALPPKSAIGSCSIAWTMVELRERWKLEVLSAIPILTRVPDSRLDILRTKHEKYLRGIGEY